MVIRVAVVVACFISQHWMAIRMPEPHWVVVVVVVVTVTTALVTIFLISTSLVVEQTLERQTI